MARLQSLPRDECIPLVVSLLDGSERPAGQLVAVAAMPIDSPVLAAIATSAEPPAVDHAPLGQSTAPAVAALADDAVSGLPRALSAAFAGGDGPEALAGHRDGFGIVYGGAEPILGSAIHFGLP